MTFDILQPDFAFLRFLAYDESTDDYLGHVIVPATMVGMGFRHVPLYDKTNSRLHMSSLFVNVHVAPAPLNADGTPTAITPSSSSASGAVSSPSASRPLSVVGTPPTSPTAPSAAAAAAVVSSGSSVSGLRASFDKAPAGQSSSPAPSSPLSAKPSIKDDPKAAKGAPPKKDDKKDDKKDVKSKPEETKKDVKKDVKKEEPPKLSKKEMEQKKKEEERRQKKEAEDKKKKEAEDKKKAAEDKKNAKKGKGSGGK